MKFSSTRCPEGPISDSATKLEQPNFVESRMLSFVCETQDEKNTSTGTIFPSRMNLLHCTHRATTPNPKITKAQLFVLETIRNWSQKNRFIARRHLLRLRRFSSSRCGSNYGHVFQLGPLIDSVGLFMETKVLRTRGSGGRSAVKCLHGRH